jgi:hypothetical protein
MDTDNVSQNAHRHETDLRVIGQALETLGIDSFDLVLAGDNFVVQGGPESPPPRKRPSAKPRLQLFRLKREKVKPQRTYFYISGMRFRDSDVLRLNRQAKDIRSSAEQCPDTQSLSHGLRMIGAHIDTKGGTLLRVIRQNQLFTVWYKGALGRESKETFTQTNLYDCGCISTRNEETRKKERYVGPWLLVHRWSDHRLPCCLSAELISGRQTA